ISERSASLRGCSHISRPGVREGIVARSSGTPTSALLTSIEVGSERVSLGAGSPAIGCGGRGVAFPRGGSDREDLPDDVAVDVGEAVVATGVTVGQSFVTEAHDVQNRRVQVMDMDLISHGVPAEVVGGPVDVAASDASPGQPHGEPEGVVLAPVSPLSGRGAP